MRELASNMAKALMLDIPGRSRRLMRVYLWQEVLRTTSRPWRRAQVVMVWPPPFRPLTDGIDLQGHPGVRAYDDLTYLSNGRARLPCLTTANRLFYPASLKYPVGAV